VIIKQCSISTVLTSDNVTRRHFHLIPIHPNVDIGIFGLSADNGFKNIATTRLEVLPAF